MHGPRCGGVVRGGSSTPEAFGAPISSIPHGYAMRASENSRSRKEKGLDGDAGKVRDPGPPTSPTRWASPLRDLPRLRVAGKLPHSMLMPSNSRKSRSERSSFHLG